ncbi:MAG: CPBP family intramembrane metalloprotease [Bacteroidetes bacterium]|nr:MAG: CPBP family intramembrane metalloprotease [Bacteroidota bacterium]
MNPPPTSGVLSYTGQQLKTNKLYQLGEILLVFLLPLAFIWLLLPLAEENSLKQQAIVWVANLLMLLLIWTGMRLRRESPADFGLHMRSFSFRAGMKTLLLSLLVFVLAMAGFMLGAAIMINFTGMPQTADMSGYDFLRNNFGLFLLSLLGVYLVSSFGEEVIYRAFLINRLTQLGGSSKTAKVVAVMLSAIVFGLVHYSWGPTGIVQTACMGLVLGICYLRLKKRLWILVLAHAYMDTLLFVQMYLGA